MKTLIAIIALLGITLSINGQNLSDNNEASKIDFFVGIQNEFINSKTNVFRNHHSAGLELG